MDDVMFCAIALGFGLTPVIYRRNPTPEELADPNILVGDVGGQYNPELGNFDHHQRNRAAKADCAMWMLCRYIGIGEQLMVSKPWYRQIGVLDDKGVDALADTLGRGVASKDVVGLVFNPINEFFLDQVGALEDINYFSWVSSVGMAIKQYLVEFEMFMSHAHDLVSIVHAGVLDGFDATKLATVDALKYLDFYRASWAKYGLPRDISFSITKDDRGPGLSIYRYPAAADKLDLCKSRNHRDVSWCHPSGFLLKISTECVGTALDLVESAVITRDENQVTMNAAEAIGVNLHARTAKKKTGMVADVSENTQTVWPADVKQRAGILSAIRSHLHGKIGKNKTERKQDEQK